MAVFNDVFGVLDQMFADVDQESDEVKYYKLLDEIATAVVDYRIKNKLSQAELAEKLGITQAMVSKYESGDYNISVKALIKLLAALEYDFQLSIVRHEDCLSEVNGLNEMRGHYQDYYTGVKKGSNQIDDGLRLA